MSCVRRGGVREVRSLLFLVKERRFSSTSLSTSFPLSPPSPLLSCSCWEISHLIIMRVQDTNTVSLPRTRCFHSRGKISRLIRQTIAEVVHCLPLSTSTIALYSLHVCPVVSVSRNAEWCPCPNLCVRCPVQHLLIDDKRGVGGVDIATWGHIPGTTLCNTYLSLNSILTHQR